MKNDCNAEAKEYTLNLFAICKKIEPYVDYYRKQIRSYNNTAHHILKKMKLSFKCLPHLPTNRSVVLSLHWSQASYG